MPNNPFQKSSPFFWWFWKLILFISLTSTFAFSVELSPNVQQLMKQESKKMETMRHKLKELLERQHFEETLQDGRDIYTDFQQLDQWLQHLEQKFTPETMKEVLKILDEFEKRLSAMLEQQEYVANLIPENPANSQPMKELSVSSMMDQVRQLLQEGKIQEAQELLNQMLSAFDQQQQMLQDSVSEYYDSKFSKLQEIFGKLAEMVQKAKTLENRAVSLVQPYRQTKQLNKSTQSLSQELQNEVTGLTQSMQNIYNEMEKSPLLPTNQFEQLLQQTEESSEFAEMSLKSNKPSLAYRRITDTQNYLNRLQQSLSNLQQKARQLGQSQQISQTQGRGRYWGGKRSTPF